MQQYDSAGAKVNGEIQVNNYTDNHQLDNNVTSLSDGGYIVTWMSEGQDGRDYGVYLQRFDSGGDKVGAETHSHP